jgi:hypothetical protein
VTVLTSECLDVPRGRQIVPGKTSERPGRTRTFALRSGTGEAELEPGQSRTTASRSQNPSPARPEALRFR